MVGVPEPIHFSYIGELTLGELTYRSKCARRLFSMANQTITPKASHMIHPVIPGPVAKLSIRNPTIPLLDQLGSFWDLES